MIFRVSNEKRGTVVQQSRFSSRTLIPWRNKASWRSQPCVASVSWCDPNSFCSYEILAGTALSKNSELIVCPHLCSETTHLSSLLCAHRIGTTAQKAMSL
jgi:hypothetical protein